jgi:hypothetical protein
LGRQDISAGGAKLAVSVEAPHREYAGVRTDFMVERWDEEQTVWAHNRLMLQFGELHPEPVKIDFANLGVKPYMITVEENCNLIVVAGWAALFGGVAGTTITNKFSATQGRIGVGTSSTAAASSQTTLVGDTGGSSTTSQFVLCGAAPTLSTAATPCTMVFTATFTGTLANFAWNEFGTDNWNVSGVTATGLGANEVFFNRGVSAQGTKASGQTWTATETLSFGFPSGAGTVN